MKHWRVLEMRYCRVLGMRYRRALGTLRCHTILQFLCCRKVLRYRNVLFVTLLFMVMNILLFGKISISGVRTLRSLIHYPLDVDLQDLVRSYKKNNGTVTHKPINEYNYRFISNVSEKCRIMEQISLIILIKSAVPNSHRRNVIRETWGNEIMLKEFLVKSVFVVGNTMDSEDEQMLEKEKKQYRDVIHIDFLDNYYNNTLKAIGALRWVSQYCNNTSFVMLADDDYYVAPDFITYYLKSLSKHETEYLLMGRLMDEVPERRLGKKWYISKTVYPYDSYPIFVSAGATIMSTRVATDLNIAIPFTKIIKFDDIYIGIMAYKLGLIPRHHDGILNSKILPSDKRFHCTLASHRYSKEAELRSAWTEHRRCMQLGIERCVEFGKIMCNENTFIRVRIFISVLGNILLVGFFLSVVF